MIAAWIPMRIAASISVLAVFRRKVSRPDLTSHVPRLLSGAPAPVRCAIRNLLRPDFRPTAVLAVLVCGGTLLSAIEFGKHVAARELLKAVPEIGRHNLYVIGAGRHQVERAMTLLSGHPGVNGRVAKQPLAWLRLKSIDGRPRASDTKEMWHATCSGTAGDGPEWPITISRNRSRILSLQIGSVVTFASGQGDLRARVTAIRQTNSVEDNIFGFVFPCRAFAGLPLFYYGGAQVEPDSRIPAVRRWMADVDPALGTLPAAELLSITERAMADAFWMLEALSLLAMAGGAVLLAMMVASTQATRATELAVFKALGARSSTLILILITEYATLAVVAALISGWAGTALASGVLSYILGRSTLAFAWTPLSHVAFVVLVILAGMAASVRVLRRRPMDVLRDE
jgi:hypothetical protein